MQEQLFTNKKEFILESGSKLSEVQLAYTTFGTLNASGDNVIWVFHALTANANPLEWWPGFLGDGKLFDPKDYFIVCVNMPGSCYGSIQPLSVNIDTGKPFYHDFPLITPRDMVRMYAPLREKLGIKKIALGIGGSMGGMQLIEWAIEEPELFHSIILMATNAVHSPWGIAFNETQRVAIETDPTWQIKNEKAGLNGLALARSVAMLSYRSHAAYGDTQRESSYDKLEDFLAGSYQRYQGQKLANRFNTFSYYALTKSMDSHNVARGRQSLTCALKKVKAQTLVIGIKSDLLFPTSEQELLAEKIPDAVYYEIDSIYGHDGFLIEYEKMKRHINPFLIRVSLKGYNKLVGQGI